MNMDKDVSTRDKKESRYDSIREAEKRTAELRSRPKMHSKYVFNIPIEPPPGWAYAWIRTHFREGGEADVARDSEVKQMGWTPVPATRHPELCLEGLSGNINKSGNVIQFMGQMLVEIPLEIQKERTYNQELLDMQRVNDLQMKGVLMGDPDMPMVINTQDTRRGYAVPISQPQQGSRSFGV